MDKKKKKNRPSSLFQHFPSSENTRTVSPVSPPSLSLSFSSMAEEPLSPKPSLAATQRASMASNRLQSPTSPFFLASNDDQLERAQARAARAAANRRIAASTTAPSPPPDSFLSKERIIDLYHNCIKLASENKINQKNTWELMLIDHLSEVIKVEAENNAETNFQKASCTLEAGVKIYSARVDAVHSEAYKVLGGINRAGIEDEQDGDNVDNGLDSTDSKKNPERKISPLSTLESSFEVLNVKKFDGAFSVDPLYHQISAKFDEGGAKGLLLNNLGVYGGCRVLFDSFEVPGKCKSWSSQNNTSDLVDLSFAKESIEQMMMNMRAMNEISPTLKDIVHLFDSDNQRPSQTFDVGQESDVIVDAYDDNEFDFDSNLFGSHDASISDHDHETNFVNQSSSSGDPTFQSHHEGNDPYTFREPVVDNTFEKFSMFLFQGLGVASKQNAWAGPDHWKYCRSKEDATTTEGGPTGSTKRAKKKILAEVDIEFKESLDEEVHDIFLPPKNPKSLLLPANRTPANNRLPEDCHYQPEDLIKLFLLPNVLCLGKRRKFFDDNSWQGNNDFDEALPSWDNESVLDGQYDDGRFHNDVDNLDRLVSQPRRVNRIEVQYDKTSKQVDVHSLKETLWDYIQESSEASESQKLCKETISFRCLLSSFPVDCQAAAPEDISPHLCFICLLHLANEHGLNIRGSPSLDDLSIHLPSSCGNSDGGSSLHHNQDAT
ncbi:condensin complex subunit 2-like isoform X2 [Juglans microcarpa x Juglans regia]|uniref:condensin complex subunit 2-like isoform X2 n=1 Tax=Juglans microcarpa x Juglans regia TaxID=2249226 RepID=UPI001B7F28BC|nr:condensin complex subunit 2-like isoform X2 [Juglans microcarpa x Juglans regia]